MDCRKFRKMVSRDLDGELDEAVQETLRAHLAFCAGCRRFREISLAGITMHRSAIGAEPSPSLLPSILAAVEVEPRRRLMPGWLRFAVPTAAAAATVFGIWMGNLMHESYAPKGAAGVADALELAYLDEFPPGSMGEILMTTSEGGEDE